MNAQYEQAKKLVKQGLLSVRTDGDVELFCYTKECFFGKDTWNDITKSHRGQMYYNGIPVNKPFKKIFNVGEVEETSLETVMNRMASEPYKILHKSNGHLFIVSCYKVAGDWVIKYSTKGSLPNEWNDLLNADIKIWKDWFEEKLINILSVTVSDAITLMFEAIVEHDKHTLFDLEVDRYGSNIFVLLGGNSIDEDGMWHEISMYRLKWMAEELNLPCVQVYSDLQGSPTDWLDHKNTEGYVIWFENGDRVKVKTKEYWLARTKKDLTPEYIVRTFRTAGFDRLNRRFPEEITEHLCTLVNAHFVDWLYQDEWTTWGIPHRYHADGISPKDIMSADDLTKGQKEFLVNYKRNDDKDPTIHMEAKAACSKDKRQRFYDHFINHGAIKAFQSELEDIIEGM